MNKHRQLSSEGLICSISVGILSRGICPALGLYRLTTDNGWCQTAITEGPCIVGEVIQCRLWWPVCRRLTDYVLIRLEIYLCVCIGSCSVVLTRSNRFITKTQRQKAISLHTRHLSANQTRCLENTCYSLPVFSAHSRDWVYVFDSKSRVRKESSVLGNKESGRRKP